MRLTNGLRSLAKEDKFSLEGALGGVLSLVSQSDSKRREEVMASRWKRVNRGPERLNLLLSLKL